VRYLFRFLIICAFGVMPLVGCSEGEGRCDVGAFELQPGGNGQIAGTGGMAGTGGSAGTTGQVFPCTEEGIRDAIAEGGGPHSFDCDGSTPVVTEATIEIDNDVILDGQAKLTVDGNEEHRVFFVHEGVAAELIGFTVTRGRVRLVDIIESCVGAPGILCHPGNGAGIKNHGALTLTNSTVTECFAPWQEVTTPGARYGGRGGGIHNGLVGTMTLTNSTVSGNTAVWGGGIDNDGVMTMTNSMVSENRAAEWRSTQGGGITNYGTLTVTNSAVLGNTSQDDRAGGIESTGTLTLTNSTVSENSARLGGGIDNYGTAILMNTTVSDNVGGGISHAGHMTVVNSTVSGNTVLFGGISSRGGSVELINTTVSDNTPAGIIDHGETEMTLTNTLVDNDCRGIMTSKGHNIESPGNTCGFDQPTDQVDVSAEDLKLGPLQDNGGPTETHALGESSVAIDVIPEADCVDADGQPLTTDQRGEPRP